MRSHSCYILVDEGFRNAKYAPSGEVKLKSEEPVKDANWVGYGGNGIQTRVHPAEASQSSKGIQRCQAVEAVDS